MFEKFSMVVLLHNKEDYIDYDELMYKAMIGIIKEALSEIAKNRNDKKYCLVFEINTKAKNVVIPKNVLKYYPESITLIIQHQFSDLKVFNKYFSVNLSFSGEVYNVKIPFNSIIVFSDRENEFEARFDTNEIAVGSRGGEDEDYLYDYDEEFIIKGDYEPDCINNNNDSDNIINFSNLKNKK